MLKILFIGDIVGNIARKAIAKAVPQLRKSHKIDYVIANAENSAHGSGVTDKILRELMDAQVDFFTLGDHAFTKNKVEEIYANFPIIRPANFSPQAPGLGYRVVTVKKYNLLIINLIGRVFMKSDYECPFNELDEILAKKDLSNQNLSAIIVDIHGECSSEKRALGHYADGRVSAMLGTHTHIPTADSLITKKGEAYITDVGMVGAYDSCLGLEKEGIIKSYLTQIKQPKAIPEKGQVILNAVLVTIDPKTKKTKKIEPINQLIEIK